MRRFVAILLLEGTVALAQQAPITKVQTALNHLTVIEMPEPITMAAAGSDAFDIKRHGNRVFVEPVRPNVSTNLFLWTAHGESIYELAPAGEVSTMNVLIASKPAPTTPGANAPNSMPDSEVQKIADMVFSRALLQTEHISQRDSRPRKDGVSVTLDEVVRAKDTLYVRYHIANDSQAPYRVLDPSVQSIRPAQSPVSLPSLVNMQVGDKFTQSLGLEATSGINVVRCEIHDRDIPPGHAATGVVGIRIPTSQPQLYRFIFGNAGTQEVSASAVL